MTVRKLLGLQSIHFFVPGSRIFFVTITPSSALAQPRRRRIPNILFIIMDDVGIDQMQVFGYGGATPPSTPNIDQIADAGIRFHNTWSMPACSTSRAVFFDGRFPLRTNVFGALGPDDLANSQVSPFEMTAPKLLTQRGYQSALFGKFHLGLQGQQSVRLRDAEVARLGLLLRLAGRDRRSVVDRHHRRRRGPRRTPGPAASCRGAADGGADRAPATRPTARAAT